MTEPMTPERLAVIRAHLKGWGGVASELLAEVDRLRAENDRLRERPWERNQRERLEAAEAECARLRAQVADLAKLLDRYDHKDTGVTVVESALWRAALASGDEALASGDEART